MTTCNCMGGPNCCMFRDRVGPAFRNGWDVRPVNDAQAHAYRLERALKATALFVPATWRFQEGGTQHVRVTEQQHAEARAWLEACGVWV